MVKEWKSIDEKNIPNLWDKIIIDSDKFSNLGEEYSKFMDSNFSN